MNFATIFPEMKNFHLKKDVGLIPVLLNKYKNYNSTIVCYRNSEEYDSIAPVNIEFIEKKYGDVKDVALYILKNAKKIDVLNLYHITSERNLRWILLYKLINPSGKVYLKLDADKNIDYYKYNKGTFKQKIKNRIVNKVDLITVENYTIKEYIESSWGLKAKFLPNGFYDDEYRNYDFLQKENIILTVGRIGAFQKGTEILLEAFANCNKYIKDWKLVVVGEIEKEFEGYVSEFIAKNNDIKDRVIFTGSINDYNEIRKYYRKSKIFCLPSRYESFGLVLVEALMEGCYIVTSKHEAASTIVTNEEVGTIFEIDNVNQLEQKLIDTCNNIEFNNEKYLKISEYGYSNFYWKIIIEKLDAYLNGRE